MNVPVANPNVLTDRRKSVLEYVHRYHAGHGYAPSIREIGEAVGLASYSTVHHHLHSLIRGGYLQRNGQKPRALSVTHKGLTAMGRSETVCCPYCGGRGTL